MGRNSTLEDEPESRSVINWDETKNNSFPGSSINSSDTNFSSGFIDLVEVAAGAAK